MSVHPPSGSYNHRVRREREDEYVVSWIVYRKIGRLLARTRYSRDTNEAGARKFAKKWGVTINLPPELA